MSFMKKLTHQPISNNVYLKYNVVDYGLVTSVEKINNEIMFIRNIPYHKYFSFGGVL
jgi:predicted solute-binding protein